MARFVFRSFDTSEGVAVNPLTVSRLFDYDDMSTSSTEIRLFDSSSSFASFTGSGFRFGLVGGEPMPISGTLNGLTVREDGVTLVQVTGWDIDVRTFIQDVAENDFRGVLNQMVGGNDTMIGTSAGDLLVTGAGRDVIRAGAGADRALGGSGRDTIYGQSGNDQLLGGSANDRLYGARGADTLSGGSGNDLLNGGSGYDKLRGGAGNDVFVFGSRDGRGDRILDFQEGADRIRITDAAIDFADVSIRDSGTNNSVIEFGSTRIIVFNGQDVTWDAGDFIFA